jgi:DNA processing protein
VPARSPSAGKGGDCQSYRTAAGLLALQSLPGVGPRTALKVALGVAPAEVTQRHLRDPRLGEALDRAREQVSAHERAGLTVLGFFDERYPARLREITDPPLLLFARGVIGLLSERKLAAVVGTRRPTAGGEATARRLTKALAGAGWAIVSGLAAGIDAAAHRAALEVGAPNIAVVGGGLDGIMPTANELLAEGIVAAGGILLSEHPLGTPTLPAHLVARNRLLSGIAAAILVLECEPGSGTMHTARYAAAQGRPIFVPDPPPSGGAVEGTRLLLDRFGAQPLHADRIEEAFADVPLDGRGTGQLRLDTDPGDDQPSQGSV